VGVWKRASVTNFITLKLRLGNRVRELGFGLVLGLGLGLVLDFVSGPMYPRSEVSWVRTVRTPTFKEQQGAVNGLIRIVL